MMKCYDLFETAMSLILKANKYINIYEKTPRAYGTEDVMYMEECHTLEMIGNNPNITISDIARNTGKTKSASSQLIDRLVKKGFLLKEGHPSNNRSYKLKLTEKGNLVFRKHQQYDKDSYKKIMEALTDFTDEDINIYIAIQKKINEQLMKNAEIED